jgi:hypothetical protein
VRDRKNAYDDPWIVRPRMELLCRAEKEMQILLQELIEILRFDLVYLSQHFFKYSDQSLRESPCPILV